MNNNALKSIVYENSLSDHDLIWCALKKHDSKYIPRVIYKNVFAKIQCRTI